MRTGHVFGGWFTTSEGTGTAVTSASDLGVGGPKRLTLYAQWNAISYPVTFDPTGGSTVDAITVTHGDPLPALGVPTRTGFDFVGWFTAATNGTEVLEGAPVAGAMTLYARWAAIEEIPPVVSDNPVVPDGSAQEIAVTGLDVGPWVPSLGFGLVFLGAAALFWRNLRREHAS